MNASFSPTFLVSRDDDENGSQMRHQEFSSGPSSTLVHSPSRPPKKRRHRSPNPADVEIIALSPTTLQSKKRFICEVCYKGFQREQNLQLHRRGHNLPWKLKQNGTKEMKRKLYLCPEIKCPSHELGKALGDLTGIKKHFLRKHGEKKFHCKRCSKKYAVPSDVKAHKKTCGTKDYFCDCGTPFSRRDSFLSHKALCEALKAGARNPRTIPRSAVPSTSATIPRGYPHFARPHHHQPQASQNQDILRLGRPGPQYNMFMNPSFQSGPSMLQNTLMNPTFQPTQGHEMQLSQPLFGQPQMPNYTEGNQVPFGFLPNYTEGNQVPFGFLPPTQPSSSFDHGLMQFTDQIQFGTNNTSDNAAASSSFASLLNFSFFPENGTNNTNAMDNYHSGFGENSFNPFSSGNMSAAYPPLYSTALQDIQNPSTAQMSATAFLQNATQFGSTSTTDPGDNLLQSFLDSYQPYNHNANDFGAFGDNGTDQLHDIMNPGSSTIFGGTYNGNLQDMNMEDQFYGDGLNENLAAFGGFGGEDMGLGSWEQADPRLTRDYFGEGQQMVNTNVGDVDVSSLAPQAGNKVDVSSVDPQAGNTVDMSSLDPHAGNSQSAYFGEVDVNSLDPHAGNSQSQYFGDVDMNSLDLHAGNLQSQFFGDIDVSSLDLHAGNSQSQFFGDIDVNSLDPHAGNSQSQFFGDVGVSSLDPQAGNSQSPYFGDMDMSSLDPQAGNPQSPYFGDVDASSLNPQAGNTSTSWQSPDSGDVEVLSLNPQAGNTSTSSQSPEFEDVDVSPLDPEAGSTSSSSESTDSGDPDFVC